LRRASTADAAQLAELAGRDSAQAPEGEALVAEAGGRIIAAVAIADDRLIADPFERTGEAAALLMLRAQQIRGTRNRRRKRTVMRTPVAHRARTARLA
jgi:hypothetical protein